MATTPESDRTGVDSETAPVTQEGTSPTVVQEQIEVSAQVDAVQQRKEEAKKELSPEEQEALLATLQNRFQLNRQLHPTVQWTEVHRALQANPEALWSLQQLEMTGGQPDVLVLGDGDETDATFLFVDYSEESPEGRRNVVYDAEIEKELRRGSPNDNFNGNAADKVTEWRVDFMDQVQYRALQKSRPVDRESGSLLKTPKDVRKSSRVLLGFRSDRGVRVDQPYDYHHYKFQGFRCALKVPKAA